MVATSILPPVPTTLYGPSATVSPLPHPATALSSNSGNTEQYDDLTMSGASSIMSSSERPQEEVGLALQGRVMDDKGLSDFWG
ncbi:hypothetical protein PanWU01x14_074150 [Parasponia andersonii]|uniref:Uncharacterized protein n=1 Tax=Parasponia andersonii TaxID=3476 RepID=A0A2P5DDA2_PARAD|nr:hypothetical protein PanWU01x14_074150 [Parasponia andersonii]